MYETIQREERLGYLPCPQTAIAIAALDAVDDAPAVSARRRRRFSSEQISRRHPRRCAATLQRCIAPNRGGDARSVPSPSNVFARGARAFASSRHREAMAEKSPARPVPSPSSAVAQQRRGPTKAAYLSTFVKTHKTKRWAALARLCVSSSSPSSSPSAPKRRRAPRWDPPPPPRDAAPGADAERRRAPELERRASIDAESAQRETKRRPPRARHRRRRPAPVRSTDTAEDSGAATRSRPRGARPPNVAFAREPQRDFKLE